MGNSGPLQLALIGYEKNLLRHFQRNVLSKITETKTHKQNNEKDNNIRAQHDQH